VVGSDVEVEPWFDLIIVTMENHGLKIIDLANKREPSCAHVATMDEGENDPLAPWPRPQIIMCL
jgi:hypothetical protein